MAAPVDLLLITWNRREYATRTVASLLKDPTDFRLYCWDNGSSDGTADLIASLADPRIVEKHLDRENVGQRLPSLWFFEKSKSDVIGKIDDDILVPHGWIQRIAPMIRNDHRFGILGCWTFMPEDWSVEYGRRNVVKVGDNEVLRCVSIGGCALLVRKDLARKYEFIPDHGFPVDQVKMSQDGLIVGYPVPLLFAHHMDDPRSEHCVMTRAGGALGEQSSLTARRGGFRTVEEYTRWIAADARKKQRIPFSWLLLMRAVDRSPSLRRLLRPVRALGGLR